MYHASSIAGMPAGDSRYPGRVPCSGATLPRRRTRTGDAGLWGDAPRPGPPDLEAPATRLPVRPAGPAATLAGQADSREPTQPFTPMSVHQRMSPMRHLSRLDRLLTHTQQVLATLAHQPQGSGRPCPGEPDHGETLSTEERDAVAAMLRVDHAGEVCAQALYQAQGLTARDPAIRDHMAEAAREENDHLAWCRQRLDELDSHTSRLNPLWYAGSLAIGTLAGAAGDRWSLGFVGETERQVSRHLAGHLDRLPGRDSRSRAILGQMRVDEEAHGSRAMVAGGKPMPLPVRLAMRASARVMTTLAARI